MAVPRLGGIPFAPGHGLADLLIGISHLPWPEIRHMSPVDPGSQKLKQAAQRLKTLKSIWPTTALQLIGSQHQLPGPVMVYLFWCPTLPLVLGLGSHHVFLIHPYFIKFSQQLESCGGFSDLYHTLPIG